MRRARGSTAPPAWRPIRESMCFVASRGRIPLARQPIGRRAYPTVLKREPDAGSRGYVDRVLRDKWTQQDVKRELRRSPEYRQRSVALEINVERPACRKRS